MRNQKGITLMALVITIIVMLILVGVSVTVALNGGLFSTAKEAADGTATKRNEELQLSDGKVEINGEWYNSIDEYVNGGSEGAKVTITPQKETYTIGEEVTIGEESFYVIADDTEKVTLLAKDNIDTTTLVQDESADLPVFSSENYWSSETEYPLDLNNYTIPEGVTSVITTAKAYGTKIGGTGRLMTEAEANVLFTTNNDILCGTNGKSSSSSLNYWLGFAGDASRVCYVWGSMGQNMMGSNFDSDAIYGVRPVVEISKSNIS